MPTAPFPADRHTRRRGLAAQAARSAVSGDVQLGDPANPEAPVRESTLRALRNLLTTAEGISVLLEPIKREIQLGIGEGDLAQTDTLTAGGPWTVAGNVYQRRILIPEAKRPGILASAHFEVTMNLAGGVEGGTISSTVDVTTPVSQDIVGADVVNRQTVGMQVTTYGSTTSQAIYYVFSEADGYLYFTDITIGGTAHLGQGTTTVRVASASLSWFFRETLLEQRVAANERAITAVNQRITELDPDQAILDADDFVTNSQLNTLAARVTAVENAGAGRTLEQLQDAVALMFTTSPGNVTPTYNDVAGTISLAGGGGTGGTARTDASIRDVVWAMLSGNASFSYDSNTGSVTFTPPSGVGGTTSGLTQAQVDARIRALVLSAARTTGRWDKNKLPEDTRYGRVPAADVDVTSTQSLSQHLTSVQSQIRGKQNALPTGYPVTLATLQNIVRDVIAAMVVGSASINATETGSGASRRLTISAVAGGGGGPGSFSGATEDRAVTEPSSAGYWTIGGRNFYRRILVPATMRADMLASSAVTVTLTITYFDGTFSKTVRGSEVGSEFEILFETQVGFGARNIVVIYSNGYFYFSRDRGFLGADISYADRATVSWT